MTAVSATVNPPSHPAKPLNPADYRPALVNVGTIVWLASELMFFSGLFAAYLTLRAATPVWPPLHDAWMPRRWAWPRWSWSCRRGRCSTR